MKKNHKEKTSNTFTIAIFILVGLVIMGLAFLNNSRIATQKEAAVLGTNNLIGKPLPALKLVDNNGDIYSFENLKGKNIVLFFNEGLMCYPACWNQMAMFGTDSRFNSNDTQAISVITDSPQDWQTAIQKMPDLRKATTLFDIGAGASRELNVLFLGSSMHPGHSPGHTYILIDKAGIVRDIIDDPAMAINNDKIFEKISKF